jgi:hypothetical protein
MGPTGARRSAGGDLLPPAERYTNKLFGCDCPIPARDHEPAAVYDRDGSARHIVLLQKSGDLRIEWREGLLPGAGWLLRTYFGRHRA